MFPVSIAFSKSVKKDFAPVGEVSLIHKGRLSDGRDYVSLDLKK
jgi:hypothetical protein